MTPRDIGQELLAAVREIKSGKGRVTVAGNDVYNRAMAAGRVFSQRYWRTMAALTQMGTAMYKLEDDRGCVYLVSGKVTFTHIYMEPDISYVKDEGRFVEEISGKYEIGISYGLDRTGGHFIQLTYVNRENAEAAFERYSKLLAT